MKKLVLILILLLIPLAYAKEGSMKLLAVTNPDSDNPKGSIADLYLEIQEGKGRVFIDSYPLSKIDTQISTRFANKVACNLIEADCSKYDFFYTIRSNSPIIGGPSAGSAIAVLTVAVFEDLPVEQTASITGTINSGGIIGPVGGVYEKIKAGSEKGITTFVIPKFSSINESNLSEYEELYGVKIYEISQLNDAIKIFTGKDYSNDNEVEITSSYIDTMGDISRDLCERANQMSEYAEFNSTEENLLIKGQESLEKEHYYSAASFCFGASLGLRHIKYMGETLDEEQIKTMIDDTRLRVFEYEDYINMQNMETLTDLESFMAVTQRLIEANEHLDESINFLDSNETNINASLYQLSYAIERLNSAKSWSVFSGTGGRQFDINSQVIKESCLNKIGEVEERIQYVNLFLPSRTQDAQDAVDKSYLDYNKGHPEQCLYKSSLAKARIDLLLNSMSINPDKLDLVIEDRLKIVESLIAKQNQKGIFPIIAYSYYEYANSLKETDQFSALLYLEYALELSNLDIYFERKTIDFNPVQGFDVNLFLVFTSGVGLGMVFGVILMRRKKH